MQWVLTCPGCDERSMWVVNSVPDGPFLCPSCTLIEGWSTYTDMAYVFKVATKLRSLFGDHPIAVGPERDCSFGSEGFSVTLYGGDMPRETWEPLEDQMCAWEANQPQGQRSKVSVGYMWGLP